MKTLIINGSPRINGNTSYLVSLLKSKLEGSIVEISTYHDDISPCIDCRHCNNKIECSISDDMKKIYADDYDNLVIASPVYYGMLTGPMVSLASRLQIYHFAQPNKNSPRILRPKQGALILTGGGKNNSQMAQNFSHAIFNVLNVKTEEENIVLAFGTDDMPTEDNADACSKVIEIAKRVNKSVIQNF